MDWTDVLIFLYLVFSAAFFYHAGELSGEIKKRASYRRMEWLEREIDKRGVMIERMKRAGRKRRKQLKEARAEAACAILLGDIEFDNAMSLLRRNDALRRALAEILFRVSRSRWEAKRYLGILKKHGVIRW